MTDWMVLDRWEEDIAVLETPDGMETVPARLVEKGVEEGDVLRLHRGMYRKDHTATRMRREAIDALEKGLRKK